MLVSIITIVKNSEDYIQRTLNSVFEQDYKEIEYIVIDGCSTDKTFEIIKSYANNIDKMISEPDAGISDAWNKGLGLATGQVIGLINAGDEYAPDAVTKAVAALLQGNDIVYGDTDLVGDDGVVLRHNSGRFSLWIYSAGFGFYHPSCFATRALYDRIGGFNPKFRYAMDSDWIARAVVSGAKLGHSDVRTRMVDGGISVKSRFLAYGEHLQALSNAGIPARVVFGSMVMTGLRGLARAAIGGARA